MPIVFDPGVDDSGLGQDGTPLDEAWVLSFIAAINAAIAGGGGVPTMPDTNASHNLTLAAGSDLSANRTLTLTTGDASRTIILIGSPTMGDWFDQAVKTTSSPTFAGVTLTGPMTGVVQTTTTTGTQNDFALTSGCTLLRCNNATLLTLNGLAAGVTGQRVRIVSVGAGQVDLANENAGSTAANRLTNGVTATRSLAAGTGTATIVYDATSLRWRVTEHEQGAWITPAYASGNFTASGSMTWTVESGDVTTYAYVLHGRTLTISWWLTLTTVGGTLNTGLQITIPGGFTASKSSLHAITVNDAGAANAASFAIVNGATTLINLYRPGTVNWSAATNTTNVYGTIVIEVQ